jgi:thymidine kinase
MKSGAIHLILGCMFSGKTEMLISKLNRHGQGQSILAVNHELDKRYATTGLVTHDGKTYPGARVSCLSEIFSHPLYTTSAVIGVDEGNFYPDIYSTVIRMVEQDQKIVYISGLNGSSDRIFFGSLHLLIPFADSLTHLTAICSECKDGVTPGIFSYRKQSVTETMVQVQGENDPSVNVTVGGEALYQSLCRYHFNVQQKNK